jgi:peptide/nickel transport system substrate-binding protein
MTQDANGQRITALLFPALTRLTSKLQVEGDLAESFSSNKKHLEWTFKIRPHLQDHGGQRIDASLLAECYSNYRNQKPLALAVQALSPWKSLKASGNEIRFELEKPDPYFHRNVSVLRYFRQIGRPACTHPSGSDPLIGAGEFRATILAQPPEGDLTIEELHQGRFAPRARLIFVRDENTRIIRMLRGQADVAQNAFSPARFRWLMEQNADRFALYEASGVNVSYLSFNVRNPILSNRDVRLALSHAIPVSELIDGKMARMADKATSFLSPLLAESTAPPAIAYDLKRAESLLDQAGFTRQGDTQRGRRFSLRFKTTPLREGHEPARILQEQFSKIGVDVQLEVVEPAVFLASIRRGAYELALGRWVGVGDPSILERTLRSTSSSNRAGYSSPEMDALLDRQDWRQAQLKMLEDLPYFPLWFWKNAVLVRKGLIGIDASAISLSGGLRPLMQIHEKPES